MIIVQDIFICKPGNASKLANLFKEIMNGRPEHVNILTAISGEFNKVIMLSKYESMTAYEHSYEEYMQDAEEVKIIKEKMKGYHEMYDTGSREIYQIW